jgi:hypothetical protein
MLQKQTTLRWSWLIIPKVYFLPGYMPVWIWSPLTEQPLLGACQPEKRAWYTTWPLFLAQKWHKLPLLHFIRQNKSYCCPVPMYRVEVYDSLIRRGTTVKGIEVEWKVNKSSTEPEQASSTSLWVLVQFLSHQAMPSLSLSESFFGIFQTLWH